MAYQTPGVVLLATALALLLRQLEGWPVKNVEADHAFLFALEHLVQVLLPEQHTIQNGSVLIGQECEQLEQPFAPQLLLDAHPSATLDGHRIQWVIVRKSDQQFHRHLFDGIDGQHFPRRSPDLQLKVAELLLNVRPLNRFQFLRYENWTEVIRSESEERKQRLLWVLVNQWFAHSLTNSEVFLSQFLYHCLTEAGILRNRR